MRALETISIPFPTLSRQTTTSPIEEQNEQTWRATASLVCRGTAGGGVSAIQFLSTTTSLPLNSRRSFAGSRRRAPTSFRRLRHHFHRFRRAVMTISLVPIQIGRKEMCTGLGERRSERVVSDFLEKKKCRFSSIGSENSDFLEGESLRKNMSRK